MGFVILLVRGFILGRITMRVYLLSCFIAIVIAIGAVVALSTIQRNADVAFSTTGVRI